MMSHWVKLMQNSTSQRYKLGMALLICTKSVLNKRYMQDKYLGLKRIKEIALWRRLRAKPQRKIRPAPGLNQVPVRAIKKNPLRLPVPNSIHDYIDDAMVAQLNPDMEVQYSSDYSQMRQHKCLKSLYGSFTPSNSWSVS